MRVMVTRKKEGKEFQIKKYSNIILNRKMKLEWVLKKVKRNKLFYNELNILFL